MQNFIPQSKTENIVVQILKTEVLIYDLQINRAYCLNETAALVYNHCDGKTSFSELRRKTGKNLSDEVIWLAIEELNRLNLLTEKAESGTSRRALLQKAALSAVALPIVSILIAPRAAHAASGANTNCTADGDPTTNPQNSGSGQDTCIGAGVPDDTCCSGTASGEFFFGNCFTTTCGPGPGCTNPGGNNDGEFVGTVNTASGATCQDIYASQCCTGQVAQAPDPVCNGPICDCRCGSIYPL